MPLDQGCEPQQPHHAPDANSVGLGPVPAKAPPASSKPREHRLGLAAAAVLAAGLASALAINDTIKRAFHPSPEAPPTVSGASFVPNPERLPTPALGRPAFNRSLSRPGSAAADSSPLPFFGEIDQVVPIRMNAEAWARESAELEPYRSPARAWSWPQLQPVPYLVNIVGGMGSTMGGLRLSRIDNKTRFWGRAGGPAPGNPPQLQPKSEPASAQRQTAAQKPGPGTAAKPGCVACNLNAQGSVPGQPLPEGTVPVGTTRLLGKCGDKYVYEMSFY